MICPYCRQEVENGKVFCPICGQNIYINSIDNEIDVYWEK